MAETLPQLGRVRVSLGTSDLAEALREAAVLRAEPWRLGRALPTAGSSEAARHIEDWLSSMERRGTSARWREQGNYVVRQALREMGGVEPAAVSGTLVERWLAERRARTSDNTAAQYFRVLKAFFRWMVQVRRIRASPMDGVVPPPTRPIIRRSFLAADDARRLLEECRDEELKFCLYCSLHAGLRKGEIIAAQPRWFDLGAGLLHVQNGPGFTIKDRDDRTIPLTEEFRAFLKGYGLREPYMLAPKVKAGKSRYRFDFQRRWNSHLKACGIKGITFHDLRRTFASLLVSSGVSLYKVARWLGDGVDVVEKRYAHLVAQDEDINRAWSSSAPPHQNGGKREGK